MLEPVGMLTWREHKSSIYRSCVLPTAIIIPNTLSAFAEDHGCQPVDECDQMLRPSTSLGMNPELLSKGSADVTPDVQADTPTA